MTSSTNLEFQPNKIASNSSNLHLQKKILTTSIPAFLASDLFANRTHTNTINPQRNATLKAGTLKAFFAMNNELLIVSEMC